ncbi:hypothetical protein CRUP_020296 [Coryphaenoides rupestris]|nr:hypothetical protein CRUP_020296 [Coryphaenoides rupestris]
MSLSALRSVEHCFHMCDRMVIYFFIAASYAPWLNLRELGPWASHMRWLVWPEQAGLCELLIGGAFYCLGMVFFKSDGIVPFAHAIWHLFVAMGAAIHYYAIWKYLYAQPANRVQTSR